MSFRHFPVDSSNLRGVAYDPETRELVVNFKTGDPYHYTDVPAEHVADIMFNKSVGKAFNALVKKGGFTFRKLRMDEVTDLGIELPGMEPRERVLLADKVDSPAEEERTAQKEGEVDTPDFTLEKALKDTEPADEPEEPAPATEGRFPVPLAFPDEPEEEEEEGTVIAEPEEES